MILVVTWIDGAFYATIAHPKAITNGDQKGFGTSKESMNEAIEEATNDYYSKGLRTDDLFGKRGRGSA